MSEASEPMPATTTTTNEGEQRVFIGDVSWGTFEALLRDAGSPRGRFAYDQGLLEIMSPSFEHESIKKLIGRVIEVLTLELAIPMRSASSTTLKRKDQRRAVESDECYYVAREELVRHRREIKLKRDPPPDLVVEVDISRSSLARLRIYAALGVPEVWQWHGDRLVVLQLGRDGTYAPANRSSVFPMLPIERVAELVEQRHARGETELMCEFQAWVREKLRTD